jgi:hypothetical protein
VFSSANLFVCAPVTGLKKNLHFLHFGVILGTKTKSLYFQHILKQENKTENCGILKF